MLSLIMMFSALLACTGCAGLDTSVASHLPFGANLLANAAKPIMPQQVAQVMYAGAPSSSDDHQVYGTPANHKGNVPPSIQ